MYTYTYIYIHTKTLGIMVVQYVLGDTGFIASTVFISFGPQDSIGDIYILGGLGLAKGLGFWGAI